MDSATLFVLLLHVLELFGASSARTLTRETPRNLSRSYRYSPDSDETCGRELFSDDGSLESPGYPKSYSNSLFCFWTITTGNGTTITIEFTDLDVEYQRTCLYDYVMIRDGGSITSPLMKRGWICGGFNEYDPPIFTSTTNEVSIIFKTDSINARKGFSLHWDSEVIKKCPDPPPCKSSCPACPTCLPSDPNGCPPVVPCPSVRAGNNTIREDGETFNIDMQHNSLRQDSCGRRYNSTTGSITSPGYPRHYPNNMDCIWEINTEEGTHINIQLQDLEIEYHPQCLFDVLFIRDGKSGRAPIIRGHICGAYDSRSSKFSSTGNHVFIHFKSDAGAYYKGFSLTWNSVTTHDNCPVSPPCPEDAPNHCPDCKSCQEVFTCPPQPICPDISYSSSSKVTTSTMSTFKHTSEIPEGSSTGATSEYTTVNVVELKETLLVVEANISQYTKDLNKIKDKVQDLETEIAEKINDLESMKEIAGEIDLLFDFSRRQRGFRSSSEIITIEYCPAENGNISDTVANLLSKGLTDIIIIVSLSPFNETLAKCLMSVLIDLNSLNTSFSQEEKTQLQSKKNEAKNETAAVIKQKEENIKEIQTQYNSTKIKVTILENKISSLNNKADIIKEKINTAKIITLPSDKHTSESSISDFSPEGSSATINSTKVPTVTITSDKQTNASTTSLVSPEGSYNTASSGKVTISTIPTYKQTSKSTTSVASPKVSSTTASVHTVLTTQASFSESPTNRTTDLHNSTLESYSETPTTLDSYSETPTTRDYNSETTTTWDLHTETPVTWESHSETPHTWDSRSETHNTYGSHSDHRKE